MKTFWFATLAAFTSLVLGTLVSQSFGDQRGLQRVSGMQRNGSLQSGAAKKISGGRPSLGSKLGGGFPAKSPVVKPTTGFPVKGPVTKPTLPAFPIKPPVVKPTTPVFPVKPPIGPIKPPGGPIGPIKPPIGPIKPPVGPIGPIGPIKPPVGPIKPPVGPIGPIGPIKPPVGPVNPLPPICPPNPCPPKPCPPVCPPFNPGYCGPWLPLPGWLGCYQPCQPICVTLPTYATTPVIVNETVVVESAPPAVAVVETKAEAKLMQVPVGATLTLSDKNLGEQQGQVILQVEPLSVPAQVNQWQADQANVTLPMFGLAAPTKAQLWLIRADGQVANMLAVELIPAQPKAETTSAASLTAEVTAK